MGEVIIKSKIVFATFVLFILISLTCVSAADNNQTDVVGEESDAVTGILTDDTIVGNFTTLNDDMSHAETEIKLDKDYTYNSASDGSYRSGIVIDKDNFVVDGQGHIINGGNQARIFHVQANNVTLKNITFLFGSSEHGGAVYFNGTGIIIGCNFTSNSATYWSYGGAVYFNNNGIVENSNFYGNRAIYYGGAIYFSKNATVMKCNFTNNQAEQQGSAIHIRGEAIVENSNFDSNHIIGMDQEDCGGAIGLSNKARISNCTFNKNYVEREGNGIAIHYDFFSNKKEVIVENSLFTDNYHDRSFYKDIIRIDDCLVKDCTFLNNEGGVYIKNNGTIENCNFTNTHLPIYIYWGTVINCSFINSTSNYGGGAISFMENGIVVDCYFENNKAPEAGAIYSSSDIIVKNSKFINNTATSGGAGAIYSEGNMTVLGSYFENNQANSYGGAIYVYGNDKQNCLVDNSQFYNNQAQTGGAIATTTNITITNSIFEGNKGSGTSFNVYLANDDITFIEENNTPEHLIPGDFTTLQNLIDNAENNYIVLDIDYLYDDKDSAYTEGIQITKNNLVIDGNAHTIDGQGIARIFNIAGDNVTLMNINFLNGNATSGGAIWVSGNLTVDGCNFTNNRAGDEYNHRGGAICQYNSPNRYVIIRNSIFEGNFGYRSGAVQLDDGLVDNCKFIDNHASMFVGAIHFNREGMVKDSIFINNYIDADSGGVKSAGSIYFGERGFAENCTFINCSGPNGGAIYFDTAGRPKDCSFINCSASQGGAIYFDSIGTVENCGFIDCTASEFGAIYTQSQLTVENSKFINNTATSGRAGAIYCGGNITVLGSYFENNRANTIGGAIYIASWSRQNCLVDKSEFYNNEAQTGGAISTSTNITVTNSIFRGNKASGKTGNINLNSDDANLAENNNTPGHLIPLDFKTLQQQINNAQNNFTLLGDYLYDADVDSAYRGGVVIDKDNFVIDGNGYCIYGNGTARIFYVTANNVTIKNLNFIGGFVSSYDRPDEGGAIYFNGTALVENCNFTDNYAYDMGGAIYIKGNGTVRNCNFINNTVGTQGGAIFFNQYAEVENCVFDDNYANAGGAILFYSNGSILKNSVFTNNNAQNGGAVAYAPAARGSVNEIVNCKFINNTAQHSGAIESWCDLNVNSCDFTNNSADKYGGAIKFVEKGTVEKCNFTNNKGSEGGAINFGKEGAVIESFFESNNATDNGGAIYFSKNGNVTNCNFTNNNGALRGGAIYFSKNGNVTNCNFTNNEAVNCGAIFFSGNGTVTNCNFTNNHATKSSSGAIHFAAEGTVEGSNFINNTAGALGGAIYFIGNGTVEGSNFINNTANSPCGAICFSSNGTVKYSNFINNTANGLAGAIQFSKEGTVVGSTFKGNVVKSGPGGAIYFDGAGTVEGSNFINNTAKGIGGAIYFRSGGNVSGAFFEGNEARDNDGGAIFSNGRSTVENSNFTNNKAKRGGAIFAIEGNVVMSYFEGNDAMAEGGAIYFSSFATVDSSSFIGNNASITNRNGGAIYFSAKGNVTASEFMNNEAVNGGAVFFNNGGNVKLSGFDNNHAELRGGALFFNQISYCVGELGNNNFTANSAKEGGAVYFIAVGNLYDNNFISNSAENGGAILAENDLDLCLDKFKDNTATRGTNNIALMKNGKVTSQINTTPSDLRPFKPVDMKIINVTENVMYGDNIIVSVNLTNEGKAMDEGMIVITINGVNYTGSVKNGTATITMQNLNAGIYDVNVSYSGDPVFTKSSTPIQFNITPVVISMDVTNVTDIVYGDKLIFSVKLSSNKTNGEVYLVLGSDVYSTKATNGTAVFEISKLNAGSYNGIVIYRDANYLSSAKYINFTVEKRNAEITAADAAYVINYGGTYTVKVTGAPNERITFTLNGKNIGSATTNANGAATITLTAGILKTAKAGTHNLVIKLDNANYNCLDKTVKITVKKEAAKIVAKKKTFKKAKKVKKYTITLKNSKGKGIAKAKVTLKIKKKTYKATTNAKGKAVFKIKKLTKKGNYKATITYKGDGNYNKVTKKIKIGIK